MRNEILEKLVNNQCDLSVVESTFKSYFDNVRLLGPCNFLSLGDHSFQYEGNEGLLAFWLIGASMVFNDNVGDCPNTADEAWQAVQYLIKEILPEGFEPIDPTIKVVFSRPFD